MDKLYTLGLMAVSSNIDPVSGTNGYIKELLCLPLLVLQDLLPYLCPKILMTLHKDFERLGVSVNSMWEYHYKKRWPYEYQAEPKTLDLLQVNWQNDFCKRYLQKHFHSILRTNSVDGNTENMLGRGIKNMFTSMEGHRNKQITRINLKHMSDAVKNEITDLKVFLPHVSYLSINPFQCEQLLQDQSILSVLRQSVSRVDVHALKNGNFRCFGNLLSDFLHHGCLEEVNIFNPALDSTSLYSLFHLCAGHSTLALGTFRTLASSPRNFAKDPAFTGSNCDREDQVSYLNGTDSEPETGYFELDSTDTGSDGDECVHSLFDDALQRVDHTVFTEMSNSTKDQERVVKRECDCHNAVRCLPYKGLKGFSVISPSILDPWLTELYEDVLPHWPSLEAICLSGVDLCDTTLVETIGQCTSEPWRLREIILEEPHFSYDSFFQLFNILVKNYENRPQPMHRLKLASVDVPQGSYSCSVEDTFPESFQGFVTLELVNVTLNSPAAEKLLFSLMSRDTALKNLTIACDTTGGQPFQHFLQSFNGANLDTLNLRYIGALHNSEEMNLCPLLKTMTNLQDLSLCHLLLPSNFLLCDRFFDCLMHMTKLRNFSVSHCRLGNSVGKFLTKLLTDSRHTAHSALQSIDVSLNDCSEDALEEAAKSIVDEDNRRFGSVVKHLQWLNISRNSFSHNFAQVSKWKRLVKNLEAVTDFSSSYDDYVAMM